MNSALLDVWNIRALTTRCSCFNAPSDDNTIQYNKIFVYYELTERSSTRET